MKSFIAICLGICFLFFQGLRFLEKQESDRLSLRLTEAVKADDIRWIQGVLDLGANPNRVFESETPVLVVTKGGKPETLKYLLEHGADPNCPASLPPLYAVIMSIDTWPHMPEYARILLEHGANPNIPMRGNYNKLTPLQVLRNYKGGSGEREEIRQLLVSHGGHN